MNDLALKQRFSRLENSIAALTEAVNTLMRRVADDRERQQLLTISAAARELGISVNALRQRVLRGTVNSVYKDGHYYFDKEYVATLPKK